MLIFENDTIENMYSHAEDEYPKECCGIILGRRSGKQRIAYEVIRTGNMEDESQSATHFLIDPLEIVKAEISAEKENLEIIGFYHSHPDYEASASKEDASYMIEGYSYSIISVKSGRCVEMKSFEKIKQTDTDTKEEIWVKEK